MGNLFSVNNDRTIFSFFFTTLLFIVVLFVALAFTLLQQTLQVFFELFHACHEQLHRGDRDRCCLSALVVLLSIVGIRVCDGCFRFLVSFISA